MAAGCFFEKRINAEAYFYNKCYFFVFLFFSVIEMISENLSEMISYELLVASCKLWVAILRKLIYKLGVFSHSLRRFISLKFDSTVWW